MQSAPEIVIPRRLVDLSPSEQALFRGLLGERQQELEALLVELRHEVDAELAPRLPSFAGKPYPLGRCREIRDAVFLRLARRLKQKTPDEAAVLSCLRDYLRAGGYLRKIWGALRERYFQNALQLGDWYVDVGNDTVDPAKPKIEILPQADSGFVNLRDYQHFCRIAETYWGARTYANTVFPRLAPLFPLICATTEGRVWLAPAYDEMIELTRSSAFRLSESILAELPSPPEAVRSLLAARAARQGGDLLTLEGDAEEACRIAREAGSMHSGDYRRELIEAWQSLNRAS